MEISEIPISPTVPWSTVPLWLIYQPTVDMALSKENKDESKPNAQITQVHSRKLLWIYSNIF